MIKNLEFSISSLRSRANWAKYRLHTNGVLITGNYTDWNLLGIKSVGVGGIPIKPTKAEALYYKYLFNLSGSSLDNLNLYIEFLDYSERMDALVNLSKTETSNNLDYLSMKNGHIAYRVNHYKDFVNKLGYSTPLFTNFSFDDEFDCLSYLMYSHTAIEGSPVWNEGFDRVFSKVKEILNMSVRTSVSYKTLLPRITDIEYSDKPYKYTFELSLLDMSHSSVPVRIGDSKDLLRGKVVKPKLSTYCFISSSLYKAVLTNVASPSDIAMYKDLINKILNKDYVALKDNPNVLIKEFTVPPATTVSHYQWYRYIPNTDINDELISGSVDDNTFVLTQILLAYQGYMANQVLTTDLSSCCQMVLPTNIPTLYHNLNLVSDFIDYSPPLLNIEGLDTGDIEGIDKYGISSSLSELLETGHSEFELGVGINYNDYVMSIVKCVTQLIYDTDSVVMVDYRR